MAGMSVCVHVCMAGMSVCLCVCACVYGWHVCMSVCVHVCMSGVSVCLCLVLFCHQYMHVQLNHQFSISLSCKSSSERCAAAVVLPLLAGAHAVTVVL